MIALAEIGTNFNRSTNFGGDNTGFLLKNDIKKLVILVSQHDKKTEKPTALLSK
ncbi:unknown [[Mannheimia] succiniciproducens MBEL55E]|uniref:Uncharacterized protein n=1 Tax=Mannheimia succiniciproducens (strain KCTC 0769BP / MBEL55E) TaxID=221988 RepID=Q65Q95_MANSM|nr:unknown [[Mannheimia] succiniciproducens MBEL55E]